jgi:hypothetical protein
MDEATINSCLDATSTGLIVRSLRQAVAAAG